MAKRKSLPWRTNLAIAERDGFRCWYCGVNLLNCLSECVGVSNHILPVAREGTNEPTNLVLACYTCNERKRALTLEEYRARIATALGRSVIFFGEGQRDVSLLCMFRHWRTFPGRKLLGEAAPEPGLLMLNYDRHSLDLVNRGKLPALRVPPATARVET